MSLTGPQPATGLLWNELGQRGHHRSAHGIKIGERGPGLVDGFKRCVERVRLEREARGRGSSCPGKCLR